MFDLISEWVEPEPVNHREPGEFGEGATMRKLTAADIENHSPVGDDYAAYTALADVLNDAYMQSARGKGHDRHSQNKPFSEQPILEIVRMQATIDGHTYQGMKKLQEAGRMVTRQQYAAAVHELYGVINYAAAAVIRIREIETEAIAEKIAMDRATTQEGK